MSCSSSRSAVMKAGRENAIAARFFSASDYVSSRAHDTLHWIEINATWHSVAGRVAFWYTNGMREREAIGNYVLIPTWIDANLFAFHACAPRTRTSRGELSRGRQPLPDTVRWVTRKTQSGEYFSVNSVNCQLAVTPLCHVQHVRRYNAKGPVDLACDCKFDWPFWNVPPEIWFHLWRKGWGLSTPQPI